MPYSLKVRSIGNACITRYSNGEAADLKIILDANYTNLTPMEQTDVKAYVAGVRPDIPYQITAPA